MELSFKLQRNEEDEIQRLCDRHKRKQNRKRIVEEMIEVKRAHRNAIYDTRDYKRRRQNLAPVFRLSTGRLPLPEPVKAAGGFVQKNYYAAKSLALYVYYTLAEHLDRLQDKKAAMSAGICAFVLLAATSTWVNKYIGYDVMFNGYKIGIVRNMGVVDEAITNIETTMGNWYQNESVSFEQTISTTRAFITNSVEALDVGECEEALYRCNLTVFANGGVITINQEEAVRMASVDDANEALALLLKPYSSDVEEETVIDKDFSHEVAVIEKIVELSEVVPVGKAVDYLLGLDTAGAPKGGDVASIGESLPAASLSLVDTIAQSYKSGNQGIMTALDFRKDDYSIGKTGNAGIFAAKITKRVKRNVDIAYNKVYQDDPNLFMGEQAPISEGIYGKKQVVSIITYENGKIINEVVESEKKIAAPIDAIYARGIKQLPAVSSTGKYLMPVYGRITSFSDSRTGSHAAYKAIDVGCNVGRIVLAADTGVVQMASTYGNYGKCVIVKHENGFSTLYAHLSEYKAKVGDRVNQGDVIALSGNTGRSTGPHLHFEVRKNDVRLDLRKFLGVKQGEWVDHGLFYPV